MWSAHAQEPSASRPHLRGLELVELAGELLHVLAGLIVLRPQPLPVAPLRGAVLLAQHAHVLPCTHRRPTVRIELWHAVMGASAHRDGPRPYPLLLRDQGLYVPTLCASALSEAPGDSICAACLSRPRYSRLINTGQLLTLAALWTCRLIVMIRSRATLGQ